MLTDRRCRDESSDQPNRRSNGRRTGARRADRLIAATRSQRRRRSSRRRGCSARGWDSTRSTRSNWRWPSPAPTGSSCAPTTSATSASSPRCAACRATSRRTGPSSMDALPLVERPDGAALFLRPAGPVDAAGIPRRRARAGRAPARIGPRAQPLPGPLRFRRRLRRGAAARPGLPALRRPVRRRCSRGLARAAPGLRRRRATTRRRPRPARSCSCSRRHRGGPAPNPLIPADRLAAIVFTSGSTGAPVRAPQALGRAGGAQPGRRRAVRPRARPRPARIVGTVPPGHMYGFETTALLPLHAACASWCGQAFFPGDVQAALAAHARAPRSWSPRRCSCGRCCRGSTAPGLRCLHLRHRPARPGAGRRGRGALGRAGAGDLRRHRVRLHRQPAHGRGRGLDAAIPALPCRHEGDVTRRAAPTARRAGPARRRAGDARRRAVPPARPAGGHGQARRPARLAGRAEPHPDRARGRAGRHLRRPRRPGPAQHGAAAGAWWWRPGGPRRASWPSCATGWTRCSCRAGSCTWTRCRATRWASCRGRPCSTCWRRRRRDEPGRAGSRSRRTIPACPGTSPAAPSCPAWCCSTTRCDAVLAAHRRAGARAGLPLVKFTRPVLPGQAVEVACGAPERRPRRLRLPRRRRPRWRAAPSLLADRGVSWAAQPERGSRLARAGRGRARPALAAGRWAARSRCPATAWFLLSSRPRARAPRATISAACSAAPPTWRDVARHFDQLRLRRARPGHAAVRARARDYQIEIEGLDALLERRRGRAAAASCSAPISAASRCCARWRATAPVPVWALMYRRNGGALTALLDQLAPGLRGARAGDRRHRQHDPGPRVRRPRRDRRHAGRPRAAGSPAGAGAVPGRHGAVPVRPVRARRHAGRAGVPVPRRARRPAALPRRRRAVRRADRAAAASRAPPTCASMSQRYAAALERACRRPSAPMVQLLPVLGAPRCPTWPGAAWRCCLLAPAPGRASPGLRRFRSPALMARLAAVPERRATLPRAAPVRRPDRAAAEPAATCSTAARTTWRR